MACPTCSKTMAGVGYGIFHCPTCGTMKNADGSFTVPALVDRCRTFSETLGPSWGDLWRRLGIEEAIHTPENRSPKT